MYRRRSPGTGSSCHTVCPAVVKQAVDARKDLQEHAAAGELDAAAVPNTDPPNQ